jgi:hypothetical protein
MSRIEPRFVGCPPRSTSLYGSSLYSSSLYSRLPLSFNTRTDNVAKEGLFLKAPRIDGDHLMQTEINFLLTQQSDDDEKFARRILTSNKGISKLILVPELKHYHKVP